jgi:hypothetical protein
VSFALGSNIGIKRIADAIDGHADDTEAALRRFRRIYFTRENLRAAIVEVVNKTLQVRDELLWGPGTVCTSDSKQLGSWDSNLMTEWHARYRGPGVMVNWHVERRLRRCWKGRGPALSRDASLLEERQRVGLAVTAAEVIEIDDFSFAGANSSRAGACRPLDRHDPIKQDLFCYPREEASSSWPASLLLGTSTSTRAAFARTASPRACASGALKLRAAWEHAAAPEARTSSGGPDDRVLAQNDMRGRQQTGDLRPTQRPLMEAAVSGTTGPLLLPPRMSSGVSTSGVAAPWAKQSPRRASRHRGRQLLSDKCSDALKAAGPRVGPRWLFCSWCIASGESPCDRRIVAVMAATLSGVDSAGLDRRVVAAR